MRTFIYEELVDQGAPDASLANGGLAYTDSTTGRRYCTINESWVLLPSPGGGGSGLALESYQNSAMSAPVDAYIFRDSSNNINRIYEPTRNNDVSRSTLSYADSIDKIPFDNVAWVNNFFLDFKLIDAAADTIISNSIFETIVVDINSHTGVQFLNHVHKGNFGIACPNAAEIYITGDTVLFDGCLLHAQRTTEAGYFDSIGANSQVIGSSFGGCCKITANNRLLDIVDCTFNTFVVLNIGGNNTHVTDCIFFDGAQLQLLVDDIFIGDSVFGCYSQVLASANIFDTTFGNRANVTNSGILNKCTIGDNCIMNPLVNQTNQTFINISGTVYVMSEAAGAMALTPF